MSLIELLSERLTLFYVLVMKGMVGNGSILEVLILVLVRQGLFMEQVSLGASLSLKVL